MLSDVFRAHFSRQRELQVKMADKILQEDERIERRKQQQPYLWSDPKAHKAKVHRIRTTLTNTKKIRLKRVFYFPFSFKNIFEKEKKVLLVVRVTLLD